jgi:hypothetical protein
MMNEAVTPASAWWVFPLVVLGFLAFWPLLCLLIARLGGWAGVAKRFAARRRPEGAHFNGLSLQIAPTTNYGGCVSATFSRDGLWLAPIWLFRPGHRPLLLPWDLVGAPVERRVLWVRQIYLPIQTGRRLLRLGLSKKANRWLRGEDDRGSWRPTLHSS